MNRSSLRPLAQDILNVADLAARHHSTPGNIRKLNSLDPTRLPPRLALGGRVLLWRLVDVEAWEASRVVGTPTARAPEPEPEPAPARRGPKSTAAKARAARAAGAAGAAA